MKIYLKKISESTNVWIAVVMLVFYNGCTSKTNNIALNLTDIWLGCYIDNENQTPRTMVLDFQDEHVYKSEYFEHSSYEGNWSAYKNTLKLDTNVLNIKTLNSDSLVLENWFRIIYKRAINQPLKHTKEELETAIENTAWQRTNINGELVKLYFTHEKVYYLPPNGKLEVHCWKVKKYNDLGLLYHTGNQKRCNKFSTHLKQILQIDADTLTFINYNKTHRGKEVFSKIPFKETAISELNALQVFQECTPYGKYSCGTIMTVNTDPGAILPHYYSKYKRPPETEVESGYLRLKFLINCRGETGNFALEGMNKNYEPYKFDEKISDQLISITKEIKNWTGREHEGEFFDCFKVIIFKINNSELADISP